MKRGMLLVAVLAGLLGCAKAQAKMPTPMPPLDTPPPPQRVVIPVSVEPVEPPPAPAQPETPPAPQRQRETPPTRPPVTAPPPTPPAQTETPPPVLQTTPNVAEMERRVRSLIGDAERDLGKVDYKTLSRDAREQYDTARGFVRQADQWLRLKNYLYAEQLATKAAALASLLVKLDVPATSGA